MEEVNQLLQQHNLMNLTGRYYRLSSHDKTVLNCTPTFKSIIFIAICICKKIITY